MRTPTQVTTKELKTQLEKSMQLLRTLRDEARVELHLAGMDAKDEWERLEPRFLAAERAMNEFRHEAADVSRKAVEGALESFKAFRDNLKKGAANKELKH